MDHSLALRLGDDPHEVGAGIPCWGAHSQAWLNDDVVYEEGEDISYLVAHIQACGDGEI